MILKHLFYFQIVTLNYSIKYPLLMNVRRYHLNNSKILAFFLSQRDLHFYLLTKIQI